MNTIYRVVRTSTGLSAYGAFTVLSAYGAFTTRENAQAVVDIQISGGDDGDLEVREENVYTSLDEYARDRHLGAYADKQIGELRYVRVNGGRGISLGRLVSRHDENSWDVDLAAYRWPGSNNPTTVVPETDILTSVYDGGEEES